MSSFLYSTLKLGAGTIYPAYESFKAVKTRNVKEYVRWMTYWIVFSLLSLCEEITDMFLSWFPFYFILKTGVLLWLLSPTTRGASLLYRSLVHPTLTAREQEIDQLLANLAEQSYTLGIRYAKVAAQKLTQTVIETAIKGGGGIVQTLQKSYSMNDLNNLGEEEVKKERRISRARRNDMAKSWHEGDDEERELEEEEEVVRLDRRRNYSLKQLRQPQPNPQPDLRKVTYRRRLRPDSPLEEDRMSDHSTDSVYSTLPRSYRRGRSQTLDQSLPRRSPAGPKHPAELSPLAPPFKQKSSSQLQLKEIRQRPVRPASRRMAAAAKNAHEEAAAAAPDTGQSDLKLEEGEDFSMSYSAETKKSCSTM